MEKETQAQASKWANEEKKKRYREEVEVDYIQMFWRMRIRIFIHGKAYRPTLSTTNSHRHMKEKRRDENLVRNVLTKAFRISPSTSNLVSRLRKKNIERKKKIVIVVDWVWEGKKNIFNEDDDDDDDDNNDDKYEWSGGGL